MPVSCWYQLCFHLFHLVQRFWIGSPRGPCWTQGALRLRAHLGTVSDDRSKMFRIFQPLESLTVHCTRCVSSSTVHRSAALGPTLSSTLAATNCFSTSSGRSNFSGSPSAMMSSPWIAAHRVRHKAVIDLVTHLECCVSCFFENSLHVSWKRRDARLVPCNWSFHLPHVSRFFLDHAADTSQSTRPLAAVHARTQRCCRIVQAHVSVPPFTFLIDAALEMIILMHLKGAVPANVSNRTPWATSIATTLLRTNGPFAPSVISSSQSTSDFLTSSHRDRNTFKQADVWSLHRAQFVYQPSPSGGDNRSPVLWS